MIPSQNYPRVRNLPGFVHGSSREPRSLLVLSLVQSYIEATERKDSIQTLTSIWAGRKDLRHDIGPPCAVLAVRAICGPMHSDYLVASCSVLCRQSPFGRPWSRQECLYTSVGVLYAMSSALPIRVMSAVTVSRCQMRVNDLSCRTQAP